MRSDFVQATYFFLRPDFVFAFHLLAFWYLDPSYFYYNFISAILPGGGKKGVAIRPYPSPGPPPFIPNAFYMCEALTGFDSCWASSPTRKSELGKASLFPKKYLHPTQNLFSATRPNRNQMPSGICTARRRLWVEWDGVQGKGQRANRNALGPSPGFKAI